MSRRSLLIGSVVLVAWAITMGLLFRDHYLHRNTGPEFTNESLFGSVKVVPRRQDIEEYMLIVNRDSESGSKTVIGASSTIIKRLEDQSTTESYRADFRLEGKIAPLLPSAIVKVSGMMDKNVNLTKFHGVADMGVIRFSATGFIRDNTLYIKAYNNNNISYIKKVIKDSVSMAEVVRPTLQRRIEIKPGSKMSKPILDPLSGRIRGTLVIEIQDKEILEIGGEKVEAYRVVSSVGDLKTTMWIDEDGNTVRRQLTGNLSMERTTRELALKYAPSLAESLEIPDLNLEEFEDVPIRGNEEPDGGSGMGIIDLLH